MVAKGLWLTLTVDTELGPWLFPVSAAAAVAVGAPALLLPGRWQLVALLAVDAIVSTLFLADHLALRGLGEVVTAASLRYAGQLVDVGDEVADLFRPTDGLLFHDLPLGLFALALPAALRTRWLGPSTLRHVAATVAIAVAFVAVVERLDPTRRDQFRGNARKLRRYGPINFHAADVMWTAWTHATRPVPSPEELRAIGTTLAGRRSPAGELAGAARGLNLIVLQVESTQAFALRLRLEGVPVMPNLERLAGESLVFEEFYEQTGIGRTADADFVVHCSQYPLPSGAVYYEYPENTFRCLPGILAGAGYTTAAFQGIRPDFWNLGRVYPRLGFQRFDHLGTYVDDERIGLGLSDATFLRQTAAKLRELPQPFYGFVVTLSCHTPFSYPEIPRTLPLGELAGTRVGAYLDALRYTDAQIGRFVEELEAAGLLERSLLVIYGDHFGLRVGRSPLLADFLGIERGDQPAWLRVERRVPLLLRLPGGKHAGPRRALAGQIDVAPTLLGLLGIPTGEAPFFGSDLLASEAGPARLAFPDGTALGDGLFWLPKGALSAERDRCFDRETHRELEVSRCTPLATWAQDERKAAETLIRADRLPPVAATGDELAGAAGG